MPVALEPYALTTLSRVEMDLGIAIEPDDEDRWRTWINRASAQVARHCNRKLHREAEQVDTLPGTSTPYLVLSRPPINSDPEDIEAEWIGNAVLVPEGEIMIDSRDAGVLRRGALWTAIAQPRGGYAGGTMAGTSEPSWRVTYDGGWITPAQSEEQGGPFEGETITLPPDIEQAVLDMLSVWDAAQGKPRNLIKETIGPASETYGPDGVRGLPGSLERLLAPYVLPVGGW